LNRAAAIVLKAGVRDSTLQSILFPTDAGQRAAHHRPAADAGAERMPWSARWPSSVSAPTLVSLDWLSSASRSRSPRWSILRAALPDDDARARPGELRRHHRHSRGKIEFDASLYDSHVLTFTPPAMRRGCLRRREPPSRGGFNPPRRRR
jgi:hypothetical protein